MKFMKLGSKPDSFQTDGKDVRFVATEVATDIIINVGDVKFYLHKFPLLSKSSCLQRLVTNSGEETSEIHIPDIPGGPSAFEICAKFCYGMTVTLNAYNVLAARCAAEYLEMLETTEKGNLIYKIEVFLSSSIFRSWKDSIIVLQTTNSLLPWSEDLKLISHCIDSIACKASIDASKVDWSYTYNQKKLPSENGSNPNWNGTPKQQVVPQDWWVEDLCELELDLYKCVVVAIKGKGRVGSKVMGQALKAYTYRKLPGFSKGCLIVKGDNMKSQAILETIVRLLPDEKSSVSCSFLTKLLRTASILDCGENCERDLVKRIGRQLEEALVVDLLLPAPLGEITVYDIDTVLSIVEEFVMEDKYGGKNSTKDREDIEESIPDLVSCGSKVKVAKLADGYLAEIAKDPNLPISKFLDLAEMVSGDSRPVHDGLYRAIDMYLKEHPSLSKSDRKKLCALMDCKKLSTDACTHAVQNERLPLRLVVQVLFFEQARASSTSSTSGPDSSSAGSYGSSRTTATTNTTDDNWVQDLDSFKSMKLNENDSDDKGNEKARGVMKPKNILGKILSSKGEKSSSDTSSSPDEPKSTPSKKMRRLVSRD